MRRTLWTLCAVLGVGCGLELSVGAPDTSEPDASRPSSSSGTPPGSSSSSSGAHIGSSSGDVPNDADASTESDASSDAETDADANRCLPLAELSGAFCTQDLCTRAENDSDAVVLPTGTMSVSGGGCGGGTTINGGHIQLAEVLPAAFRIQTHFTIKNNQAPIVTLLLGKPAPDSISQNACDSLKPKDVIVTLYRESANGGQWRLEARSKATCQFPADPNVLTSSASDTEFDITVSYDGTTLTAQGTWSDGTDGALPASILGNSPVAGDARLAFAAYTLNNDDSSKKSVKIDKLRVLCP